MIPVTALAWRTDEEGAPSKDPHLILQSSTISPKGRYLLLVLCAALAAGCGGGGGGDAGVGGGGGGGGAGGGGSGGQPAGPVTISGKARYEFPPPAGSCLGLDFNNLELRPIRQATIQILDAATDTVLDAGVTDDNGDFALSIDPNLDVYLRVRAELKAAGAPSWDVEIRDNTTTETAAGTPLALGERPLYVLDSASFDSGTADSTRDLTAATGWTGSSYTGTRAAAPFAILDTAYAGIALVLTAAPQTVFEPLDIYWSVNNTATGAPRDIDSGELGTSFYRSDNSLFLLGRAGVDADEFDDHVVAHEWGHYFEDAFSRSDSIGGTHAFGDRLDMRVAFGEGWATALSGMALDSPLYCDTTETGGFSINIESGAAGAAGWFNEISILRLVYDLWDAAVDGPDTDSLGFAPLYEVMTGAQATTPAFTSIFTFATALKAENPVNAPFIDTLLAGHGINGIGPFGEGETNHGGSADTADVLPVYTVIAPDGSTTEICSNSQHDPTGFDGNKLSEHRFLRMTVSSPAQYLFEIVTTTAMPAPDDPDDDSDQSDPDILIALNGVVVNDGAQGFSGAANQEIFTTANALAAGEYVMALVEFRYRDEESPDDYPPRTCFDVTVSAVP